MRTGELKGVEIKVENLTKKYGNVVALDNVSLVVEKSKITTLLGPSGCGKTTLLKVIAGLEKPSSGKVYFDGTDVTGLPPEKRNIGFVFQDLALFPHLDVYGNIAFGLKIRRYPNAEIRRRVREVLDLVGLDPDVFMRRKIDELSGGQKQRVAIARALVIEPSVLLLDEPFAHLDYKIKQRLLSVLKRIQKETGTTVLYVTHDQNEAMAVSHYIAVMNNGRIIQYGPPEEVYEKPNSLFVAGFFGEINVLSEDPEYKILIRPEKLLLDPEDTGLPSIMGRIEDVVFQGALLHIYVRSNRRLYKVTVPRNGKHYSPGTIVRIAWRPEDTVKVRE